MNIKKYIITEEYAIIQAMDVINKNARGIAYICEGAVLKAAVTDGNIRRYLLSNGDLNASVKEVANYSPKFIMRQDDIDPITFMHENSITSVPILNQRREIVTIKFRNAASVHAHNNLEVPIVIMAGGKGKRLDPITRVLPKPLVPVNDKTITEMIMDKFCEFGCDEFNLIVNHKSELIKAFFVGHERAEHVTFTDEPEFLGTGGGLKLLQGKYNSTFFLTNCDVLVDEDYGEILEQHNADNCIITLVCAEKNITIPYGTIDVDTDGFVTSLTEKPSLKYTVNTGVYVIEPRFLDYIPDNTFIHITDVIEKCIAAGEKVGVYTISERNWWDMGQFPELKRMQESFTY